MNESAAIVIARRLTTYNELAAEIDTENGSCLKVTLK
jgi:hypothetical protein